MGGRIAVELSKLRRDIRESLKFSVFDLGRGCGSESKSEVEVKSDKCVEKVNSEVVEKSDKFNVVVVGGTNLDYIVNISERELKVRLLLYI